MQQHTKGLEHTLSMKTCYGYYMNHSLFLAIKFVGDLSQFCGFLREIRFPPPMKLTFTILLKY